MKPRLMHFVFACLSVLYFAPTSRSLAPELQVRHDALYRQIDVATSDQQLIEIFAALAQVNSEIATSFTDPKDVRRIVQHYNDAKYYFQQAARLERRSGSDDKSQDHLLLERRRRKFIEGNAAALASAVADDAFEIGEIVYSFTKRQSGAKSEKSQRVRLVKSKRKLADQVYVQLQSGKKVKQKVPYTWLRRKQRFTMTIPRMTTTELMNSPRFLTGHYPFIVTDVLNKWPAMQRWHSLDYLNSILPNEWVDFYPKNMYELGSKPWVMPSPQALDRFKSKLPHEDEFDSPRYLQYRLSLQGWRRLEQDLFEEGDVGYGDNSTFTGHRRRYLPSALWTEADWISCFGSDKNADNFYRTNQWNMLMIGEKGTGIFFHHDHLAAASWSAQVVGRKQWVVCPYNQSHLLSTDIFTFDADYESFPGFADAVCGETTVQAGELLYYPAYWCAPFMNLTVVGVASDANTNPNG